MSEPVEQVLIDIEKMRSRVPFGEVAFTLQQHAGETVGLVANIVETKKYPDNASAATAIIQALKESAEIKANGTLSFSVSFRDGQISKMMWQGYDHKNYQVRKKLDK